jgi:acyl dehydratase
MNDAKDVTFEQLVVGDESSFEKMLTEDMMQKFAELSGDFNPLHVDEAYAETTSFRGRVVYGMLGASFFSQLVGMHLPGKHAVYLSQTLLFKAPMRIGMTVVIKGTLVQKVDSMRVVTIRTVIFEKGAESNLVEGEAKVMLLV